MAGLDPLSKLKSTDPASVDFSLDNGFKHQGAQQTDSNTAKCSRKIFM